MSDILPRQDRSEFSEESKEHRKWRVFWQEIPGWLKAALIGLCGATAGIGGFNGLAHGDAQAESFKNETKIEERLIKQETKMEGIEKQIDKMDGKLDRLLSRRER